MLEVKLDFVVPEGWAIDRIGVPRKGEYILHVNDNIGLAYKVAHEGAIAAVVVLKPVFDEQAFVNKLGQILRPGWATHFDGVWYYFPKFGANAKGPKWVEATGPEVSRYVRAHWVGTKFPLNVNHLNVDFPPMESVPANYIFIIGDHSEPS